MPPYVIEGSRSSNANVVSSLADTPLFFCLSIATTRTRYVTPSSPGTTTVGSLTVPFFTVTHASVPNSLRWTTQLFTPVPNVSSEKVRSIDVVKVSLASFA